MIKKTIYLKFVYKWKLLPVVLTDETVEFLSQILGFGQIKLGVFL